MITHVMRYHKDHPNILYKQAMKDAKASYKKDQKGKGGGVSKPTSTLNPIIPLEQEPNLEQLQTESRQLARAQNNRIEAQQDQIQNRRNKLVTHIIQDKKLPSHIHNKIDSFLNF